MKPQWSALIVVFLFTMGIFPGRGWSTDSFFSQVQTSLGIPPTLGRVTDASLPSADSAPEFVLVQDVHHHPEVQSHISSLILLGYRRWHVNKVFLEGAFSRVDMSIFHRVPRTTRALLLSRLVTEGNLSGAELAAVLLTEEEWSNPPVSPFQLIGMEDPKLYEQNLAAYRDVQTLQQQGLEELTSMRRLQNSLQLQGVPVLAEQLDRTEALLRLKMTPSEYVVYLQNKVAVPSSPRLDPAIAAAERFYRLAQARSQIFLKEAKKKVPASSGPRILVVGGFHTALMGEELRKEGRSYVVIAPAVSESGFDSLYEKKIAESVSAIQY